MTCPCMHFMDNIIGETKECTVSYGMSWFSEVMTQVTKGFSLEISR